MIRGWAWTRSAGAGAGPSAALAGPVAVAALLVAAATLALRDSGPPERPPAPTAPGTPSPRSVEPPPPGPALPTVAAAFLSLDEICAPRTDRRTVLDVSFRLANDSSATVIVESIRPHLPLRGLRPVRTSVTAGTCGRTGPAVAGTALRPGAAILVTFRLALPATCPRPYPVQAAVRQRSRGRVVTDQLPLFNDLGALSFDTCR